jgi:hypothetical protein
MPALRHPHRAEGLQAGGLGTPGVSTVRQTFHCKERLGSCCVEWRPCAMHLYLLSVPEFASVMWRSLLNSFLAQIFHANCGLLTAFLGILHRHL